MKFSELMYYAEATGELPTRTGRLNAVIKDIRNIPTPTIDSDTLISVLSKNGIELKSLTQREFDYILKGIK